MAGLTDFGLSGSAGSLVPSIGVPGAFGSSLGVRDLVSEVPQVTSNPSRSEKGMAWGVSWMFGSGRPPVAPALAGGSTVPE